MSDFGPPLDRFPREIPTSHVMYEQLQRMSIAPTTTIASQTVPLLEQTNLGPGAWATMLSTSQMVEDDTTVVQILDHLVYESMFPDYQARLLKNWVMCKWASHHDHEREPEITWHLGWVERGRLVPLAEEEAQQLLDMIVAAGATVEGELGVLPSWLFRRYDQFVDRMNRAAPTVVGRSAVCGNCGSKDVELHGRSVTYLATKAGVKEIDGKDTYINASPVVADKQRQMHLHCQGCDHKLYIDPGEYHLHNL